MKAIQKTVYVIHGKGKESECQTKEKAVETLKFLEEFFNHEDIFCIEERQKIEYEIEKGDRVHWVNNNKVDTNRIDKVMGVVKDLGGDVRYKTKQINGDKIGLAYRKDLFLILE